MPILTDQERCGTLLAERYRLDAILGRGGMGVVFRAVDHASADAPVAVKILRPEFANEQTFAKRFVREARAAAAIRHPNVVEVRDLGVEPDGTIYQVLQLLEGQSLRDHLDAKETLSVERTLEILLPVMSALAAAHERGIVHRDLKPDNIFLARNARGDVVPTLLDFGIAKLLDGGGSFATHTGSIMGTPAYMAPEQAQGAKEQGPAIDVWAMGIIAFECLTGSPPFMGGAPANVMLKIMTERPPPVDRDRPEIPPGVARAIERALERDPAKRPPGIAALADALREGARAAGLVVPEAGRTSTLTPLSLSPPAPAAPSVEGVSVDLESDLRGARGEVRAATEAREGERAETVSANATRRLGSMATMAAPVRAPAAAPAVEPAGRPAPSRPRWLLAAVALVVVVATVMGAYGLVASGGASDANHAAPPPSVASAPASVVAPPPDATEDEAPTPASVVPVSVVPVSVVPASVVPPPSSDAPAAPTGRPARTPRRPPPTEAGESAPRPAPSRALPGVVEW